MPGWLRTWLFIAVIAGGVVLLWVGVTVLLVVLVAALVPFWLWRVVARPREAREARGPVTIEGEIVPSVAVPVRHAEALRDEDRAILAATPVWVVRSQDQFRVGARRGSFGVAVCFSEQDAKAYIARGRGRTLAPGYDGHEIHGPENPLTTTLFGAQRAAILDAILRRLAAGSREPIPVRIG